MSFLRYIKFFVCFFRWTLDAPPITAIGHVIKSQLGVHTIDISVCLTKSKKSGGMSSQLVNVLKFILFKFLLSSFN